MTEAKTQEAPAAAPPTVTPMDRVKSAMDALNQSVSADIHDRLHAHANALKAIADALFAKGGGT